MKIQIRKGVFETNSSSVHSIVMCKKADYDMWNDGKMLLTDDDEIVPLTDERREERKKILREWLETETEYNSNLRNVKEELFAHADDDEYVSDYTALLDRYDVDRNTSDLLYELKCGPGITVSEYDETIKDYEYFCSTKDDYVAFGYYGQDY